MKHKNLYIGLVVVVIIAIILLASSAYTVNQTQRAIELRFNKIVRNSDNQVEVIGPGLHFKVPFITSVVKMDARLQTLDDQPDRFLTSEKKDVIIDSYVKWKIEDFAKFYTTTGGNIDRADSLLRRIVNDRLRGQVAQQTIIDLVSGSRSDIMNTSLQAINDNESTTDLGVKVIDVRINKIELPDEVSNSIYARMRAERIAIAGEHRAKGQEEAQKIVAETDRNVQIIIAQAQLDAQKIRAQADEQAALIYNQTYAQSPDLFKFLVTLNAYREALSNKNSVLVFNPKANSFFGDLFSDKLITTVNNNLTPTLANPIVVPLIVPNSDVKVGNSNNTNNTNNSNNNANPSTNNANKASTTTTPAPSTSSSDGTKTNNTSTSKPAPVVAPVPAKAGN